MSVEKDIRYELLARLCPNSTGAELRSHRGGRRLLALANVDCPRAGGVRGQALPRGGAPAGCPRGQQGRAIDIMMEMVYIKLG